MGYGYGGGNSRRGGGGGRGGSYGGGQGGNRGGGGRRQEFDPTNKGAFWEVDDRDKRNDKSPDLNGKININGEDHWISGWYQRDGGGQKPVIRFALGDPCEDRGGRRDDYNRSRQRDDDDRGRGDGYRNDRDDRDRRDDRQGRDRSQDRYDNRRERDEDDRRERDDDDRRRSDESQRPFDEGRDGERGGRRGGESRGRRDDRDDDGYRDRPGPNDRNDGPPPEGPSVYDKDLDDPSPF